MSHDLHPAMIPTLTALSEIRQRRQQATASHDFETVTTSCPITVMVGGQERRFTMRSITTAQALEYVRLTERIAKAAEEPLDHILDAADSLDQAAALYIEGIAPVIAQVILAHPADGEPPLTVADVHQLDAGEPGRVLAAYEVFTGIDYVVTQAQRLLQDARARRSRNLQREIDALTAETN